MWDLRQGLKLVGLFCSWTISTELNYSILSPVLGSGRLGDLAKTHSQTALRSDSPANGWVEQKQEGQILSAGPKGGSLPKGGLRLQDLEGSRLPTEPCPVPGVGGLGRSNCWVNSSERCRGQSRLLSVLEGSLLCSEKGRHRRQG